MPQVSTILLQKIIQKIYCNTKTCFHHK
uniref:Uncharacterized protein n=1 Tax=Arundo donax TaxID=35708 RepID=A0A0A9A2J5_ARUDO